MPTITLENVTKNYKLDRRQQKEQKGKRFEVGVENVDLTIRQGEFVYLDKKDLFKAIPWSQNRTALLFGKVQQEHSLIRKMTVEENLLIAAQVGRRRFESAKHLELRVKKVLGLVGMRGVEKKYPVEMSIGECRRVELARALINSPPILVLDEITANLDDDNIWDMFQLLQEVNRKGTTVIMATHASRYVNIMRRRVVTLVDGKIFGDVEKGRYGDVV